MLAEHLNQSHDGASRRFELIDQHVAWIQRMLLDGARRTVLDLGCGPGFYLQRLSALNHVCTGIDMSPASIEYARRRAGIQSSSSRYVLGDVARADFGSGFDLVMMLHGEFNVSTRDSARELLAKAAAALSPAGTLLLEAHRFEVVRAMGQRPRQWIPMVSGLFGDKPHLRLDESRWDDETRRATNLKWVLQAEPPEVQRFGTVTQAYDEQEYRELLSEAGLEFGAAYDSLTGDGVDPNYTTLVARKRG